MWSSIGKFFLVEFFCIFIEVTRILFSSCWSNCLKAQGFITTVDLFPLTGRRHQLRRHLRLIGHPIWGDFRYAAYSKTDRISSKDSDNDLDCNCSEEDMRYKSSDKNPHSQMCLWALEISFPHPCKDETVHASIDEPLWYEELRAALSATNNKTVSA